jgi:hypothetical protein
MSVWKISSKYISFLLIFSSFCLFPILVFSQNKAVEKTKVRPPVDVVFVVDISSSTGGIVASVKSNFWEIINEMNRLKPVPDFRLSLVCLGRPSFGEENAYVKVMADLTYDIDKVANELFSIKESTAKGKVLIGDAIHTVVKEVSWSKDPNAVKVVFLVGNGGVTNGYDINKACELAKEKGIVINSLYFKTYENKKETTGWQSIATMTDGTFHIIGIKEPNIYFEKGYDNDLLIEACTMINLTYVPYGREGLERSKIQVRLDEDARKIDDMSDEARAFFKASSLYQDKNAEWDLVDLSNNKKDFSLGMLKRNYMDEKASKMNDKELASYLEDKKRERIEYINILKMLSVKREEFLKMKKRQMELYRFGDTFFGVVNRSMVKLCAEKGYILDY